MSEANKSLRFRVTGPDGSTSVATSANANTILGSGAEAQIRLNEAGIEKKHVLVRREDSGVVVATDLGSASGTKLAGTVIKKPVNLSNGDILTVGSYQVEVLFDLGAETTVGKSMKQNTAKMEAKALSGTGKNAAALFSEPLSPEATPSEDNKVLQVALVWGDTLINVQHFADGTPVSIGEGAGNSFTVYSNGVGSTYTLATSKGSSTELNVPGDAGIVVSSGSGTYKTREQLKSEGKLKASGQGASIQLGLHDRAQVSLENVSFVLRYVRPSAAVSVSRLEEADFTFFKIASMCVMAFVALVAAILLTPTLDSGLSDDIFANPSKYVKLLVKPEKKIEIKKLKDLSGIEEGAKAKDKEGKFGKEDAKKDKADPSKKGAPIVDANKREEDRKKVAQAGLLGALASGGASNVFGPGGLGTGINNALGGLSGGAGVGDAQGVGGLGSRGAGPGGGGTGLGLGGLGTKGSARGAGGYGSIDLGGRGKDSVRVVPGKTTVVGGLSKDVIAKVIKRHQNEIKYCYEQELAKTPDLAGKVAVLFTIDPAGAVSDANVSESSLGNSNTENCMLSRIRRWKFPEPQGGGVVTVTFPWIFKPAGSDDEGAE